MSISIRDTIPKGSFQIHMPYNMEQEGHALVTRDGWTLSCGGLDPFPDIVGPNGEEYVCSDGSIVPLQRIIERCQGAARIQAGGYISPKDERQDWKLVLPLASGQCCLIEHEGCLIAFNKSASPVIEYEGKEFRVFEGPIECPSNNLSEEHIGQLIDGKGILIATNVQLYDFLGRPVGPLLNYFMAPQTLGQITKEFNTRSGHAAADSVAQLRNVHGYDGAKIRHMLDLERAARIDVRELGKWHIPPIEILAGVSDMGGDIVSPHHIKGLLERFDFPEALYSALPRDYTGKDRKLLLAALHSTNQQLVNLDRSRFDPNWVSDKGMGIFLVRADPV